MSTYIICYDLNNLEMAHPKHTNPPMHFRAVTQSVIKALGKDAMFLGTDMTPKNKGSSVRDTWAVKTSKPKDMIEQCMREVVLNNGNWVVVEIKEEDWDRLVKFQSSGE